MSATVTFGCCRDAHSCVAQLECGESKQFRIFARCFYLLITLLKHLNFQVVGNVVPAAAVTPQPLVYTIIVAVKRLVVGLNTLLQTTLWTNQSAPSKRWSLIDSSCFECLIMECCNLNVTNYRHSFFKYVDGDSWSQDYC